MSETKNTHPRYEGAYVLKPTKICQPSHVENCAECAEIRQANHFENCAGCASGNWCDMGKGLINKLYPGLMIKAYPNLTYAERLNTRASRKSKKI